MKIEEGKWYINTDGRTVKVIQKDEKRERAEVATNNGNPFWVDYVDLQREA
jgi:hypothetical protein